MNVDEILNASRKEASMQEKLLPFLLHPKSYPHRPKTVRLLQTHSAFVFIAPPIVYKIKKSVNFGFLDFSTLEKRHYFCQREVELNRRLSPNIYLGVTAISRQNGAFHFGEKGEIIEYAVMMRKLSDRYFLDKLVERGEIKLRDLDRIAARLKEFYLNQHPTEEIEEWGRIERLKISTEENFTQTESFVGQTISRPAFEAIRHYTGEFYGRHAELFESRVRQRWIRDCHGDLHLEHIHITPRSLQIYDCIEFNDRLRYLDVASDIAFLAMDLDYEGRPDLARHFVHRMAAALEDPGMLRLLDFYKCYRAYVRGKVESLHSIAPAAPETERQSSAERARRYFQLALRYPIADSKPLALVIMGRIGSGKTTLARALGVELGWKVFSSDSVRKQLAGLPVHERTRAAARPHLYSSGMTERTYQKLTRSAELEVKEGRSVILDATFSRQSHRKKLGQRFASRRIHYRFVEARADDVTVRQRLEARDKIPGEISDARLEDFAALSAHYEPPSEINRALILQVATAQPLVETLTSALKSLVKAMPGA